MPDVFELCFEDTTITYAPSAYGGVARFDYRGPYGRHTFEGDAIRALDSARGREVSVTLDGVSQLRQITLTVFVPDLELDDADEAAFDTIGIHSIRRRERTTGPQSSANFEPLRFAGRARALDGGARREPVLL